MTLCGICLTVRRPSVPPASFESSRSIGYRQRNAEAVRDDAVHTTAVDVQANLAHSTQDNHLQMHGANRQTPEPATRACGGPSSSGGCGCRCVRPYLIGRHEAMARRSGADEISIDAASWHQTVPADIADTLDSWYHTIAPADLEKQLKEIEQFSEKVRM